MNCVLAVLLQMATVTALEYRALIANQLQHKYCLGEIQNSPLRAGPLCRGPFGGAAVKIHAQTHVRSVLVASDVSTGPQPRHSIAFLPPAFLPRSRAPAQGVNVDYMSMD